MADVSGTLRKLTIDGVTYDVFADTNVNAIPTQYENTAVPTSGRSMQKKVRRVATRESVTVACNADEQEVLQELDEGTDSFTISYQTAAGETWSTTGFISFESHETEENKATSSIASR